MRSSRTTITIAGLVRRYYRMTTVLTRTNSPELDGRQNATDQDKRERERGSLNGNADVKYCDKLENGLGEASAIKQPPPIPRHSLFHSRTI